MARRPPSRLPQRLFLAGLAAGALAAALAWPRINDVETGKTAAYPDLRVHSYKAGEDEVATAVKTTVGRLPRWTLVGSGSGPGGTAIHAVHATRVLRFKDDVTIRIQRKAGMTHLSVRSRSRVGKWDFGQNASNIRELLAALDGELAGRGVDSRTMACLFCEIVAGRAAARLVHEDDELLAFHDINPQAPVHVLLIPKQHVTSLLDLSEAHDALVGELVRTAGTWPASWGSPSEATGWSSTAATTPATVSTTSTSTCWADGR